MPFRILILFFLFVGVCGRATAETTKSTPAEIGGLIQKLGDDSYVVRQRTEAQLLRIGIDAFSALKRALSNEDVEIARRAEQLLAQLEWIHLSREDEAVREMVDLYSADENVAQKAIYIWTLACPLPFISYPRGVGFKNGEGFQTLCRIARFDREKTLRIEAAKCLITLPPFAPSLRKKWYQSLHRLFSDPGDDELLRIVRDYAEFRCELDDLSDRAEQEARAREIETKKPVEYPVPISIDDDLRNRIDEFTKRFIEFQAKPENSSIQPGNWIDILMHYALAEIQDAAGRNENRDRTLKAALDVRTEAIQSDNPLLPFDPLDTQTFGDHYFAAVIQLERNRLLWAREHFRLIAEHGAVLIRFRSYSIIAGIEHLLNDYKACIRCYDRMLEILKTEEYTKKYGDAAELEKEYAARRLYFLAQETADAGDYAKAVELADEAIQNDPCEIDTIILRHKIVEKKPELGQAYRDKTQALLDEAIADIERQMREDRIRAPVACNQVAWLLANTDGDFATALSLIGITIKAEPESAVYLDTQAHVFAMDDRYGEAVEAQEKAVRFAPEATLFRVMLDRFRQLRDKHGETKPNL